MADPTVEVGRISNDPDAIAELRDRLVQALDHHQFSEASAFAVRLAYEEAVSNAFRHGHHGLGEGKEIEVEFRVDQVGVMIVVKDQGPGFDPSAIPDPTLTGNLEKPSGRGLMLMRAYMTSVTHNARGNRVEMVFRLSKG